MNEDLSFRIGDLNEHVKYEIFCHMDNKLASINNDVKPMQAPLQAIAMALGVEKLPEVKRPIMNLKDHKAKELMCEEPEIDVIM